MPVVSVMGVGEFDGDGAAVDVAGVEAYVCDVAVG